MKKRFGFLASSVKTLLQSTTQCVAETILRSVANAAGVNQPNLMVEKGHKAGMDGLDEEKINRLVEEASKGSKFHAKKKADQARTSEQV